MRNAYEVLGIPPFSDKKTIRTAYRKLALKLHPDRNPDPNAAEQFHVVQQAYDLLNRPGDKLALDIELRAKQPRAPEDIPVKTASYRSGASAGYTNDDNSPPPRRRQSVSADELKLGTLLGRANYAEAESLARRILKRNSQSSLAYATLGDVAQVRGDLFAAAKYYAFAAQFDPTNPVYQTRHEQMLRGAAEAPTYSTSGSGVRKEEIAVAPLGIGVFLTLMFVSYVILTRADPAALAGVGLISEWTVPLISVLLIGGFTLGTVLSASKLVTQFQANRGSAVNRMSLAVKLTLVSVLCFWLGLAIYFFKGSSQGAFNPSLSRFFGGITILIVVFAAAALAISKLAALQVLLWSGNVMIVPTVLGWVMADLVKSAIRPD